MFIVVFVVHFVSNSVRKNLDTPSYTTHWDTWEKPDRTYVIWNVSFRRQIFHHQVPRVSL